MKLIITGQTAEIESSLLVANSEGIYTCEFEFDSEWEDYSKTAVFQLNKGTIYNQLISENECTIPAEVLTEGYIRIGVVGTNGELVMPTMWTRPIVIHEGAKLGETQEP